MKPGAHELNNNKSSSLFIYFGITSFTCYVALAVYDVLRRMSCPIITVNVGLSVGMGAVLCSLGTPGQR